MELQSIGQRARQATYPLQAASAEAINNALNHAAAILRAKEDYLLEQNNLDVARGKERGMHHGLLDRLTLTPARIDLMAKGIEEIAMLPNYVDELMESWELENGLHIEKRRVPFGVVGIIFESRPNVTADAFGLCFKSGNVVILKGGSDAINSNKAIVHVLQEALLQSGFAPEVLQLITDSDREVTKQFMQMREYVDVLIPRGGAGLIRSVVENSTIPVIETGTGNCHIYVDQTADLNLAMQILDNAKTQRVSVCNACESLVVHSKVAAEFLPMLAERMAEKGVELRGDERCVAVIPTMNPATELDFGTEYLDYILSIKIVDSLEEAIAHINLYNTKHSDAIITKDGAAAKTFLKGVDAACVYVNASTRFTDGYEFGFGAEIGISTQKLHARGPMGLRELTSYKYEIVGNGQIRT
jgi:glutamate-5-semialdehyde dehydrogenase